MSKSFEIIVQVSALLVCLGKFRKFTSGIIELKSSKFISLIVT